jgi:hypothetical protein
MWPRRVASMCFARAFILLRPGLFLGGRKEEENNTHSEKKERDR